MERQGKLSLVVVDDEALFRELVSSTLALQPGLAVVGSFGSAEEAMAQIPALKPDLALLDLDLGADEHGVELGLKLQALQPQLKVVLLSSVAPQTYQHLLQGGDTAGWSCWHKKSLGRVDTLVAALHAVAGGLQVLEPGLSRPKASSLVELDLSGWAERDLQLWRLLAQGASNHALASHFCLSEKTIEGLLAQLYRRLGLPTNDPLLHARVKASWMYFHR